jgi:hypothetical protein
MNDEHVLAFIETVDRTDFDAVGVLAADAVVVDDVGHAGGSFMPAERRLTLEIAGWVAGLTGVRKDMDGRVERALDTDVLRQPSGPENSSPGG